jgi:hypothetical protein
MPQLPPHADAPPPVIALIPLGEAIAQLPPLTADEMLGLSDGSAAPSLYMRAKPSLRTAETLDWLCECLIAECGDMRRACERAGTSQIFVKRWTNEDPAAAARINDAQALGWTNLESVAHERAVVGIEKTVWYQGENVGTERVYDNAVLMKMLQARVPGYADNRNLQGNGMSTTVNVAIMPRASSYDEWLVHRDNTLKVVEDAA